MQQEQIKTLLVNILTGAIIVGVFVVGYFVFIKKDTTITDSVAEVSSVARIAEETASIGTEIDYTVSDLKDLKSAVASSKVIFDLPAFRNLQNFSVTIPEEPVGRTNPFVPTVWKLKMKASEEAVKKSASTVATTQSATVSGTQSQSTSSTPTSLLGDFDPGI